MTRKRIVRLVRRCFTRDSALWWLLLFLAIATFVSEQIGLFQEAFPTVTPSTWAKVRLAAALIGVVAAFCRMSPFPLSPGNPLTRLVADPDRTLTINGKLPKISLALVALLLTGSSLACAGKRHPNLSPVGRAASYALDALAIAESTSDTLKRHIDAGTLPLTPRIAETIRGLGDVGAACQDIGQLLEAYGQLHDAAARLAAAQRLDEKIVALERLVTNLPRDAIADAATDLIARVQQLRAAVGQKGTP